MSIEGAAKELTKEIERLTKETKRLTKLRDSLFSGSVSTNSRTVPTGVGKTAAKKVTAEKAAPKKAAGRKKGNLSRTGRKAISDAAKRMWAEKKKAAAAK